MIKSKIFGVVGGSYEASLEHVEKVIAHGEVENEPIVFDVNSPGGSVAEGTAIYLAIKECKVPVSFRVIGEASSIASVILLASDDVTVSPFATGLIHDPLVVAAMDAGAMREEIAILDRIGSSIAELYASRTGKEKEFWSSLMNEDRVLVGSDFVEVGLAKSVIDMSPTQRLAALAPSERVEKIEAVSQEKEIEMVEVTVEVPVKDPEQEKEILALQAQVEALKIKQLIAENVERLTPEIQEHVSKLTFDQAKSLIDVLPKIASSVVAMPPQQSGATIQDDLEKEAKTLSKITGLKFEDLLVNLKKAKNG